MNKPKVSAHYTVPYHDRNRTAIRKTVCVDYLETIPTSLFIE